MYTKKDLEEKFDISDTTVYKTLQVCGLDTKRQEYTEQEIEELFKPVRKMINAGRTYKDIKDYFQMKPGSTQVPGEAETEEEFESEGFAANQAVDASDLISYTVATTLGGMVEESINEIAPLIPGVVASSIAKELGTGGKIRVEFDKMRSQAKSNGRGHGAGAAFLIEQMRSGHRQLKPATELPQLPGVSSADSQENSPENSNESLES